MAQDTPFGPCSCGSGAHPRRCDLHPFGWDRHVAELNLANISYVLAAVDEGESAPKVLDAEVRRLLDDILKDHRQRYQLHKDAVLRARRDANDWREEALKYKRFAVKVELFAATLTRVINFVRNGYPALSAMDLLEEAACDLWGDMPTMPLPVHEYNVTDVVAEYLRTTPPPVIKLSGVKPLPLPFKFSRRFPFIHRRRNVEEQG